MTHGHATSCEFTSCDFTRWTASLLRAATRIVLDDDKHHGTRAYDAWHAQQPAHTFTDDKAPA